eukprot:11177665-Lingulodinium_polyedra.AAC.1
MSQGRSLSATTIGIWVHCRLVTLVAAWLPLTSEGRSLSAMLSWPQPARRAFLQLSPVEKDA